MSGGVQLLSKQISLQLPRERVQWETAVAQSRQQSASHCATVEAETPLAWYFTGISASRSHMKTRVLRLSYSVFLARCGFFFLFPTPNFWNHWTDFNQTWTHIHLSLLFEKFGPNSPGHLPSTGWGAKNVFWDRFSNLTEHISAKKHDINNRKETC